MASSRFPVSPEPKCALGGECPPLTTSAHYYTCVQLCAFVCSSPGRPGRLGSTTVPCYFTARRQGGLQSLHCTILRFILPPEPRGPTAACYRHDLRTLTLSYLLQKRVGCCQNKAPRVLARLLKHSQPFPMICFSWQPFSPAKFAILLLTIQEGLQLPDGEAHPEK